MWCEPDDHPYEASLPPSVRSSMHPCISLNHHGAKSLVSPNQQRRPLLSLLSDSSSMALSLKVGPKSKTDYSIIPPNNYFIFIRTYVKTVNGLYTQCFKLSTDQQTEIWLRMNN